MSDINVVSIGGRLCAEPELKTTAGGTPVLNFRVANGQSRKTARDEWEEVAHFFDCVVFGGRANALAKFMRKGQQVHVSGKITQERWRDREDNPHSRVRILASEIDLGRQAGDRVQGSSVEQVVRPPSPPVVDVYDEEIPF